MLGLGSASSLGIGLSVFLDDQFTKGSSRVSASLKRLGMDADEFQDHLRNIESFGVGLERIGRKAIGVAARGIREFADFEKTMTSVAVIGGIDRRSNEFEMLVNQAKTLSGTYGQLPQDIAEAQLELAKAGKSVPEIMKLTQAVITLGAATDTMVGGKNGAAEMLVNVMQAFNAGADKASYYADVLTSAANRSTINVEDFYESLKYSSDVANSLHIPIDKAATAIATLGNAGLKGSMAGVAYANMLRYIATGVTDFGTKKQRAALAALGLTGEDFREANGNLKDLGGMLEILREKTAGLSDPDKLGVLTAIFGVRGARGLVPLMSGMTVDENGKRLQTYADMYKKIQADLGSNIAESTAKDRIDNTWGDLAKLKSEWSRFYINVGKSLAPLVRPLVSILTKTLNWINEISESPLGQFFLRWIAILFMALGPLGRIIAMGARFLMFMTVSSNTFTGGMRSSLVMATELKAILVSASKQFAANIMSARGVGMTMAGPGRGTAMLTGPGGRFLGKSNWLARGLGAIFGVRGARWGIQIARFMTNLMGSGTFLGKLVTWGARFFSLGGILLKALGWVVKVFFSWWFVIADLVVTLLTGKSILEWLWDGLKWLYNNVNLLAEALNPVNWWNGLKSMFTPHSATAPNVSPTAGTDVGKTYNQILNNQKNEVKLHVTVNPTTGDKRTEQSFNLNAGRSMASQGIKVNG